MKITLSELRNLIKNVIKEQEYEEEHEEKGKNSIYEEISQAIYDLQDLLKDYLQTADESEIKMVMNFKNILNDFNLKIAKKSFQ